MQSHFCTQLPLIMVSWDIVCFCKDRILVCVLHQCCCYFMYAWLYNTFWQGKNCTRISSDNHKLYIRYGLFCLVHILDVREFLQHDDALQKKEIYNYCIAHLNNILLHDHHRALSIIYKETIVVKIHNDIPGISFTKGSAYIVNLLLRHRILDHRPKIIKA